jgi:hypothetical protein
MTKLITLYQLKCVSNGEDIKMDDDNHMVHSEGKYPLLLPSCLAFATFRSHHSFYSNVACLWRCITAYMSAFWLLARLHRHKHKLNLYNPSLL